MGEQRNLTEENVKDLRAHLEKMKLDNPELEYRFFEQQEPEPLKPLKHDPIMSQLFDMEDKIERLEMKIDKILNIFDGHVLINGEFKKIAV